MQIFSSGKARNSNSCISGLGYRNQHSGIGTVSSLEFGVSVLLYGYRYRLTLVSVPPFEYRYWEPGNSLMESLDA
ncbi:hypothetical protein V6N12_062983 [Hibiscus sabdariffa]|uniref:Uncharacterized protein n=1 Tax=Hibiscus sabdariffa TaxID=183260 RepID=A0ABR2FAI4_9ROSI